MAGSNEKMQRFVTGEALVVAVVILAVNLADAFTLADRLVRVRCGASCEVYERSEFDRLPFSAPWLNLYRTP